MFDNIFSSAARQYSFLISNPYALRFLLPAANRVVPLPAHGSITTSPSSVNIFIKYSRSFTGFCGGR